MLPSVVQFESVAAAESVTIAVSVVLDEFVSVAESVSVDVSWVASCARTAGRLIRAQSSFDISMLSSTTVNVHANRSVVSR